MDAGVRGACVGGCGWMGTSMKARQLCPCHSTATITTLAPSFSAKSKSVAPTPAAVEHVRRHHCRGFPRALCSSDVYKHCEPADAFSWTAKVIPPDGCSRIPNDDVAVVPPVCANTVAMVVMSSNATSSRMAAASMTWIPAASALGMHVFSATASAEAAAAVRRLAPGVDVRALGIAEFTSNGGSAHVAAALRLLAGTFPSADWYVKVDDDAFVFPSNLLHALSYVRANASQIMAVGNTLTLGGNFVSGGASYVLSREALHAMLRDEAACFGGAGPAVNEDVVVSACLQRLGARFVHAPGFNMAQPTGSFTVWRKHQWNGAARFPVSFHWLKDARTVSCLACTCEEF